MIQYLDLNGLTYYDTKIKEYIQENIPEIAEAANAVVNAMGESGEGELIKIAVCTQEDYDNLGDNWEEGTLYIISDDNTISDLHQLISEVSVKIGSTTYAQDGNNVITIPDYPTKTTLGLDAVTNDKQVKAINSSTNDDIVIFSGTTGDTVADSGTKLSDLQPKLIGTDTTGQNIKTINNASILGSGNINLQTPLTAQTAYEAKGSATKVPQITTNSLGQVTAITEVTITQPTVNNGTLTIQKNGTDVATFSANDSGTKTANITVPTADSNLSNDRYVRFDINTQNLTSSQQGYARTNIGLGNVANKPLETSIDTSTDTKDANYASIGAIKTFVNSSINSNAAFFRGNFDNYETSQESGNTTLMGVAWQTTNPSAANYVTNNDYAYVNDDETHNHEAWRYIYVLGSGWEPQFKVNEAPFTASQLAAINSGITATIVSNLDLDNRLQVGTTQSATGNVVQWATFQFIVVNANNQEETITLTVPCQVPTN